jgi:hypothetical protein
MPCPMQAGGAKRRARLPTRPLRPRQSQRAEARKRQGWQRTCSWRRSTSGGLLSGMMAVQ